MLNPQKPVRKLQLEADCHSFAVIRRLCYTPNFPFLSKKGPRSKSQEPRGPDGCSLQRSTGSLN